jgi:DNA-binding NarL/FixJ family response regulator
MLRVVVVEERQAVRDGFKRLLAGAGEITVVGEASDAGEATELARRVDCDLLVVGMAVLGHQGQDAVRRLKSALPGLHVLAVGPAAGPDQARETVEQGASGYLDINRAREDLVKAVRAVCRGSVFVSAAAKAPRRPGPAPVDE